MNGAGCTYVSVLALLLSWSGVAEAEGRGQAKAEPARAAASVVSQPASPQGSLPRADAGDQWLAPNAFLNAANQISRRAAAGEAAKIYDQVSPILKARFTREAFVAELNQRLAGKVVQRNWQNISQVMVQKTGNDDPNQTGEYVTVTILSLLENSPSKFSVRKEVLSFFHEKSGEWLLSGYQIDRFSGDPESKENK